MTPEDKARLEINAKFAASGWIVQDSLSASSAVKNPGCETGAEILARILAERRKNWLVAPPEKSHE